MHYALFNKTAFASVKNIRLARIVTLLIPAAERFSLPEGEHSCISMHCLSPTDILKDAKCERRGTRYVLDVIEG